MVMETEATRRAAGLPYRQGAHMMPTIKPDDVSSSPASLGKAPSE